MYHKYLQAKHDEVLNMLDRRYCSSMDFAHAKEQFDLEYDELVSSLPATMPDIPTVARAELLAITKDALDRVVANKSPFAGAPYFEGFTDSDHFDIIETLSDMGY